MTTTPQAKSTELELLQEILSIDSTWGKEKQLAEFIADQLRGAGVEDVALVESMPGRPSVAGRLRGTGGGRSLILNGHLDIYEVSPDWQRDPFGPEIDDGLVGQQVFAGEATRLAYGTDEAAEGRDSFLEKREPDWSPFPWHY